MRLNKVIFTLFIFCYSLNLSAQNWIPRLNKNGTYSLVTEQGKLINTVQYDLIQPLWRGDKCAIWQAGGQQGCIFPNKISIRYEKNMRHGIGPLLLPVLDKHATGTTILKDYAYLMYFASKNLLVNMKTGKYIEDEPSDLERQNIRTSAYFPFRNGLMKISATGKKVNFVDQNFNTTLSQPIYNGEMATPDVYIIQDSISKKYGLIDAKGNMKIPFTYEKMYLAPTRSHIIVKANASTDYKYGLLNLQGQLVLDTAFYRMDVFAENLYIINTADHKSGILNQFLEPIIPFQDQYIQHTNENFYQEKYIFVSNRYKQPGFLLLDTSGNIVLQSNAPGFNIRSEIKCFGLKLHTGEEALYNIKNGVQLIYKDSFEGIFGWDGNDDILLVKRKKGASRLITRKGEILNTFPYDVVLPLSSMDGNYIAINEEKYGIVSPSGEVITPLIYDKIYSHRIKGQSVPITVFKTGTTLQYGIYDKALKHWTFFKSETEALNQLFPPEFTIITGKNKQKGVINRDGKQVIPEKYTDIRQYKNMSLFACYDQPKQKWRIIGNNNKVIFSFDKTVGQESPPVFSTLKSNGDYAIQYGESTLFLEQNTFKKLADFDLVFVESLCESSIENKGWVTLYKPDRNYPTKKPIWVNYYTGKVYAEK